MPRFGLRRDYGSTQGAPMSGFVMWALFVVVLAAV